MQAGEVLVDMRVADVQIALSGEAIAHRVEMVLPADERERDAMPGPRLLLVGARAVGRAPDAVPGEFLRPGHVLPLCARPGGVLERRGHTETAVDLAVLAGLPPVAVTCEVLADDGLPARLPDLRGFASDHRIAMVSVEQVVQYRLDNATAAHSSTVATLLL